MSNELMERSGTDDLSLQELAAVHAAITGGDMSRLQPAQQVYWYKQRCDGAGLDWRTEPFSLIKAQGGATKLYPNATAAQQLAEKNHLSVTVVQEDEWRELYRIRMRCSGNDGRSTEDVSLIPIKGLVADALCNAIKKVYTQCHRRVILKHCGLGTGEDDMGIAGAEKVQFRADTGIVEETTPAPAPKSDDRKAAERRFAEAAAVFDLDVSTTAKVGAVRKSCAALLPEKCVSTLWRQLDAEDIDAITEAMCKVYGKLDETTPVAPIEAEFVDPFLNE